MSTENTPENINITLYVSSIFSSASFYTENLGLELTDSEDEEWAEVSAPGIIIMLKPKTETGGDAAVETEPIGFQVSSFEAAISMLEEQHISYTIEKDEHAHLAYFTDPDGHVLYLFMIEEEPA